MTAELWLRKPCTECGWWHDTTSDFCGGSGGSEERLDPERAVIRWVRGAWHIVLVQDILEAFVPPDE
jgi:hypothetical protein